MLGANIGGSAQQHERILAMSDEFSEGLDRRNFMAAAVGASALSPQTLALKVPTKQVLRHEEPFIPET